MRIPFSSERQNGANPTFVTPLNPLSPHSFTVTTRTELGTTAALPLPSTSIAQPRRALPTAGMALTGSGVWQASPLQQASSSSSFASSNSHVETRSNEENMDEACFGMDLVVANYLLESLTSQSTPLTAATVQFAHEQMQRQMSSTIRQNPSSTCVYGSHLLDFDIIYHDGGEYTAYHSCQNVLRDDASVYCSTKTRNVNILLRHRPSRSAAPHEPLPFVCNALMVKAPASGYTSPIRDGLIFVSRTPIDVASTAPFDHWNKEKYRAWMRSKKAMQPIEFYSNEPILYFKMDTSRPTYIKNFNYARSGSYVLIKLLNSAGRRENIDVQFIGLCGFYGPRSFPSSQVC